MADKKRMAARRNIAENRRARFDYEILDTIEAGLSLTGTEVKSLRQGKATINESYAGPSGANLFLFNAYIPEYEAGNRFNHETRRRGSCCCTAVRSTGSSALSSARA